MKNEGKEQGKYEGNKVIDHKNQKIRDSTIDMQLKKLDIFQYFSRFFPISYHNKRCLSTYQKENK